MFLMNIIAKKWKNFNGTRVAFISENNSTKDFHSYLYFSITGWPFPFLCPLLLIFELNLLDWAVHIAPAFSHRETFDIFIVKIIKSSKISFKCIFLRQIQYRVNEFSHNILEAENDYLMPTWPFFMYHFLLRTISYFYFTFTSE